MQKRGLIVELHTDEHTDQSVGSERQGLESGREVETGGEWAVVCPAEKREVQLTPPDRVEQIIEMEDVEENKEGDEKNGAKEIEETNGQCYLFEKLSDVPAVRDQSEIEAADRALERLAGRPPHQLSPSDRVWELAARGGSTQSGEAVPLDSESRERVRERLYKHKLTDKTTLAF